MLSESATRIDASAPECSPPAAAEDVLRMVLYYDVFRHPLRVDEIARLVARDPEPALGALVREGRVTREGRYVLRPGRQEHLAIRMQRSAAAERRWPAARRAGRALAAAPWVRAVLITGGLSKQSASPGGDIDFFLLVEPGRVWSAKSALQAARRLLPTGLRECFCTNYLLAADELEIDDRNAFTAMELATAVPVHNAELCARFIRANGWARAWVPGLEWNLRRAEAAPTYAGFAPVTWMERAIGGRAEPWSMRQWDAYWNRKYAWVDEDTRAQRFKRRAGVATNHLHDFQDYVLSEFERRCAQEGISSR